MPRRNKTPRKNKTMTDSVSNTGAVEQPRAATAPAESARAATEAPEAEPAGTAAETPGTAESAGAAVEAPAAGGAGAPADELPEAEAPTEEEGADAEAELVAAREELAGLNDRYLRLAAEFTNYRRRVEKERADTWARAQGEIVDKFLDALDDLQRVAALDLGSATVEGIMEGIDLVDRKFQRILGEAGIEILDPVGGRFDPQTMEAMMRAPADSEEEDDRVAQVFQKGYLLKGQLLRPARVSVLKLG